MYENNKENIGCCPKQVLQHSNSGGIVTAATLSAIVPALSKINFSDLGTMAWQILLIFAGAFIGMILFIVIIPSWKIVKDKDFAFGIAMSQFLGFPATYLISSEIANSVTDTDKERAYILERVSSSYVVAGLASVSVFSSIIAGIIVSIL